VAGRLYVVGTPIGNLEDITLRALRVLGEVAAIACEDTRQTVKILNRYGLKKSLISYFQPREGQRIPEIIGMLRAGRDVALVSGSRSSAKLLRRASRSSPSRARRL
jgi:16S rRNA (cytidine1402-2'-O)-methyltransferase